MTIALWIAGIVLPLGLIVIGVLPSAAGLVSLLVLTIALVWRIRSRAPELFLVFAVVALVMTVTGGPWLNLAPPVEEGSDRAALVQRWSERGPFDDRLPIVLHLVFDELMSPGAIDPTIPGGAMVRDAMYALGAKHGLRIFDSIYSRAYFSGISIPNMMEAEYRGRFAQSDLTEEIVADARRNAYFDDLGARGYRTAVFQTAVLNFCGPAQVRMCESFRSFDPGETAQSELDGRTREIRLWDTLLRSYEPGYVAEYGRWFIRNAYGIDQRQLGVLGTADRFDVQRFPRWFDRFQAFMVQVPRGTHVFAHFMVPHSPYLLTNSCVVNGVYEPGYALAGRYANAADRAQARAGFYQSYFKQVTCVLSKLDGLLTAVERSPAFRDATIVIHGDHGSRISDGDSIEMLSERDFIDNYGTFAAVRKPGVAPGVDCGFSSLPQWFRRSMRADGDSLDDHEILPVIVKTAAGTKLKVEAEMPVFGCAAH
jgi:hypothetical protein